MSKPPSALEANIHNTLLHIETLLISAVLIATGFGLGDFANARYTSLSAFISSGGWLIAVAAGFLTIFGLILAFSQQYLAFALTSAIQNISVVVVASILYMIGQFLIGLGNGFVASQPLIGYILIIGGYVLFAVSVILAGNTGLAISKLSGPTSTPK